DHLALPGAGSRVVAALRRDVAVVLVQWSVGREERWTHATRSGPPPARPRRDLAFGRGQWRRLGAAGGVRQANAFPLEPVRVVGIGVPAQHAVLKCLGDAVV